MRGFVEMLCRFWEGSGGFELCFGSVLWVMGDRGLGLCHEHMVAPGILQFFSTRQGSDENIRFSRGREVEAVALV